MATITFITGGQRSGKSSYGQRLALSLTNNPIYLATSRIWDEDFEKRVNRHKADRDERWTNREEEKYLSRFDFENRVVLIDCVTLWLTNYFSDNNMDVEQSLQEAKAEWDKLCTKNAHIIIISNEIGMGLHAPTESGRHFTDLQGWMNQYIAQTANEVVFMVSGIPLKIKQ